MFSVIRLLMFLFVGVVMVMVMGMVMCVCVSWGCVLALWREPVLQR